MSITLAGQTLPDPNAYTVEIAYRGGASALADGTAQFDIINATAKRTFAITWRYLTSAQRSALETAWASLKTSTATFVDYSGSSYTVARDPSAPSLKFTGNPAPGGARWTIQIQLVES